MSYLLLNASSGASTHDKIASDQSEATCMAESCVIGSGSET